MQLTVISTLMLFCGMICFGSILLSLRYLKAKFVTNLIITLLCMTFWCLVGAADLSNIAPEIKLLASRLGYVSYAIIPISTAALVMEAISGKKVLSSKKVLFIVLYATAIFFLFFSWSNPLGLFYTAIDFVPTSDTTHVVFHHGPVYYVYFAFSYGVLACVFIQLIYSSAKKLIKRRNATCLIIGIVAPMITNLLYTFKVTSFDFTPFAFVLTSAMLLILFRNSFFRRLPFSPERLLNSLNQGIIFLNENNEVVAVNSRVSELLGTDEDSQRYVEVQEILDQWLLIDADPLSHFRTVEYLHPVDGKRYFNVDFDKINGELLKDDYKIVIINDDTALHYANERVRHLEDYDESTELYSRSFFMRALSQEIEQLESDDEIILGCFSVAGFDEYSTVYGGKYSRNLLREVGKIVNGELRQHDIISRFSDRSIYFMCKISNTDGDFDASKDHRSFIPRIIERFAEPVEIDGISNRITLNIGTATCPQDSLDCDTLLSMANLAMINAQYRKNKCAEYEASMLSGKELRMKIGNKLYSALENNEFSMVYQPQIDIDKNCVLGVEALLRWNNPDLGQISPDDFIPIAEQNGMIVKIGMWAMEQAIEQCQGWHKCGVDNLRVGVNVSLAQLADEQFADSVVELISKRSFPPECLEIEITESVALIAGEDVKDQLKKLRGFGIRVAMDDFGMGHSSLTYIKHFGLDTIKIDEVLVQDLTTSHASLEMIRMVRDLGQSLDMDVIVEHIETRDQMRVLEDIGGLIVQGYIKSPPLRETECLEYMKRHLVHK